MSDLTDAAVAFIVHFVRNSTLGINNAPIFSVELRRTIIAKNALGDVTVQISAGCHTDEEGFAYLSVQNSKD